MAGGPRRSVVSVAAFAMVALAVSAALFPGALPAPFVSHPAHLGPMAPALARPTNHSFPTPIQHVIVIPFENAVSSTVLKNGPFFRYLATQYEYASHYYAVCHPSAPNYLALTSGKDWQCGSDGYSVYSSANLGTSLQAAGLTWGAYMDSMPTACATTDSYPYAVKHDPFVYYQDIVSNKSLCDSHVLPLSAWNETVANGTIPNFAFITPNLLNDGHDTSVNYADHWLRGFLGPMLNATWMNNTVIFVTYDEGYLPGGASDNSGFNGTAGGHVYFTAISPWVRSNSTYPLNGSHYNFLSTIEWLFGLPSTGHNDSPAFPAMTGLFDFQLPLTVHPAPSPMVGPAPLTTTFNVSVGNGVGPYRYNWSFGDGNSSVLPNPTHTYNRSGLYNATVQVSDSGNQSGHGSVEVIVTNTTSPVHVNVSANRTDASAPANFTFNASISGGTPPYQVRWFYNDGSPSANGSSQQHMFAAPGNYTITVAAIDAHGLIGGATFHVTVVEPLTVSLSLSAQTVNVGTTVAASALAAGGNPNGRSYAWTLNGSKFGSNASQLTYTPKGGGTYVIGVTVKDVFGDAASSHAFLNATGGSSPPPGNNSTQPPPGGGLPSGTTLVIVGVIVLVVAAIAGYVVYRRRGPPPEGVPRPVEPVEGSVPGAPPGPSAPGMPPGGPPPSGGGPPAPPT